MSFRGIMKTPPPLRQACLGGTFIAMIFLTSYCGIIVMMPIFMAELFLLRMKSARCITDAIFASWLSFASGLYEIVYGVRIVIKGDKHLLDEKTCSLIIMNHKTRLDWLFLFSLQIRHGSLRRFKISLKSGLKHIPGAGWAMQAAEFFFLKRSWESDRPHIERMLMHFKTMSYKPQMLLFPEGTDLTEKNKIKSADYAKQHGLPVLEYVLHPRTTGFTSIARFMMTHNSLDQIVDVTVVYPYNCLQNENDIFFSDLPREIVFHIKVFDAKLLPKDTASLQEWVEKRWVVKEHYLKTFYESGKYLDEECNGNNDDGKKRLQTEDDDWKTRCYIGVALLFWILLVVVSSWLLATSSFVRYFYLLSTITYASISAYVGFENLWIKMCS